MTNSNITMYGTTWCGDCHRARAVFEGSDIEFTWVDVDCDEEAEEFVVNHNGGKRIVPTIVFPDGSILVEPSDDLLLGKLKSLGLL